MKVSNYCIVLRSAVEAHVVKWPPYSGADHVSGKFFPCVLRFSVFRKYSSSGKLCDVPLVLIVQ